MESSGSGEPSFSAEGNRTGIRMSRQLTSSQRWIIISEEVRSLQQQLYTNLVDAQLEHRMFVEKSSQHIRVFDATVERQSISRMAARELLASAFVVNQDEAILGLEHVLSGIESADVNLKASCLWLFKTIAAGLADPQKARVLRHSCVRVACEMNTYITQMWGDMCPDTISATFNDTLYWIVPSLSDLLRHGEHYSLLDQPVIWSATKAWSSKYLLDTEAHCAQLVGLLNTLHDMLVSPDLSRNFSLEALESILDFHLYLLDPDDDFRQRMHSLSAEGHQRALKFLMDPVAIGLRLLLVLLEFRSPEAIDAQLLLVANAVWTKVQTVEQFVSMLPLLDEVVRGGFIADLSKRQLKKQLYSAAEILYYSSKAGHRCISGKCYVKSGCRVTCAACSTDSFGTSAIAKCAGCGVARYCSKTCQKEHWPAHKRMCGLLKETTLNDEKLWVHHQVELLFS